MKLKSPILSNVKKEYLKFLKSQEIKGEIFKNKIKQLNDFYIPLAETIYKKYKQLQELGFVNIYVYPGGLFEWLLLQDIYGHEDFPTTSQELDILKFKPIKQINQLLIT